MITTQRSRGSDYREQAKGYTTITAYHQCPCAAVSLDMCDAVYMHVSGWPRSMHDDDLTDIWTGGRYM